LCIPSRHVPEAPHTAFAWNRTRTDDLFRNRIECEYTCDAVIGLQYRDQLNLAQIRYVDYGDDRAHPYVLVTLVFVYQIQPTDPVPNTGPVLKSVPASDVSRSSFAPTPKKITMPAPTSESSRISGRK